MRIAYRRMSGTIGLSDQEPGTRGAWLEKRRALLGLLKSRGHDVELVGRLSKASGGASLPWQPPYDLLMVEFGGANKMFNGKQLIETLNISMQHQGPKVFLCDDPDLDFLWDEYRDLTYAGWSIWNNSLSASRLPRQPGDVPVFDYPFSWNVPELEPRTSYATEHLVYIGRPGGRAKAINELVQARVPFVAYANPKEWAKHPQVQVALPPTQAQRAGFYADSLGCLALADAKHKRLAWRTGRAFHALAAGCPAHVEHGHPGLAGFQQYRDAGSLNTLLSFDRDPNTRNGHVLSVRREILARDSVIAEATLLAHGL